MRHSVLAAALALASAAPNAAAQRGRDYHPADARFMREMIRHHEQALTLAGLVAERAQRADLATLADRIRITQTVEIRTMRRWLGSRGEPTGEVAHESHDRMPGMATPEEVAALSALRATAFEQRFLELMMRHHQGALTMVERLFAEPGAGREPALWEFATEIETVQRAEIDRMGRLLAQSGPVRR